jgi:tripartite-type tricarboxylate transporter receptor subunit TctC
MKFAYKRIAASLFASTCLLAGAHAASDASTYPDKPIRIIVPYPPGGSTDVLARTVGQKVGELLGQTVLVENRAGASGNIGAAYVAKGPADGYTLFLGTSTALSVNQSLYKDLPYDPQKDFKPIILATMLPSIVVVGSSLKVNTLQELNAYLKATPSTYASSGNGTPAHLGGELYKKMAGVNVVHIPYKGGAPALTDLVGGQTTYMIAILPESMPMVKSGQLKALAVTTKERLAAYPDLPTVSESGIPGYELIGWYGFLAPSGTPDAIMTKLNKAFDTALQDPSIASKFTAMGFEVVGGPANKLTDLMKTETVKWKKVIDDANIRID